MWMSCQISKYDANRPARNGWQVAELVGREIAEIERRPSLLVALAEGFPRKRSDPGGLLQRTSWVLIGLVTLLVAAWMTATGLSFDWRSGALPAATCAA